MASKYNIAGGSTGDYVQLANVVLDVWSQEIRYAAQPILRFESIATIKTDLAATPGGKLKFLRYNPLTGPSPITETETISTETLSTSYREIGTTEHAKALGFRELLLREAMVDTLADASTSLGIHYAINRDINIRDAILQGGVPDLSSAYQLSIAATKTILGDPDRASPPANRFSLAAATDKFGLNALRAGVEYLATKKAPKFGGDAYICFVHPHQAVSCRASSGWLSVAQYGDPTRIYNGEIGRIEDVRFIETTMVEVIKARTGSSGTYISELWTDGAATYFDRASTYKRSYNEATGNANIPDQYEGIAATALPVVDTYCAIMLAQGAIGIAEVLPVEMRDNGVEDFGRTRSLGYYSIYGTGVIEETFGCVLETA